MAEQLSLTEQYDRIKADYPDSIVFFRLGDFYEMFNHDAVEASRILNLTLTRRQASPMCGVPWHASRSYIARLLKAGKKIAICEQLTPPRKGKGIIERRVTEVISPGTVNDEDYLESALDTYLVALTVTGEDGGAMLALAWLSTSTGEFRAESFPADQTDTLRRELYRIAPRELVVNESSLHHERLGAVLSDYNELVINRLPDWVCTVEQGRARLLKHFGTLTLQGFGFSDQDPALAAAGALMEYAQDFCKAPLEHVKRLQAVEDQWFVAIDEASQRNLELVRNLRDGGRNGSLLATVDLTLTPMGARALRRRLLQPLRDPERIRERLDWIELFYRDQALLESMRSRLRNCLDLERLSARLAMSKAHPKDVVAIRQTLEAVLDLGTEYRDRCPQSAPALFSATELQNAGNLADMIGQALVEEPALSPADGPVIDSGWNAELAELRTLRDSAQSVLAAYLEEEKTASGLPGLKLKYNRILGYHLELGKQAARQVPVHFIRRQSVANAERFSTERLGSLETEILSAADRIVELENRLFAELRRAMQDFCPLLSALATTLADLDCGLSGATLATRRAYCRPEILTEPVLEIRSGRHPVVEAFLPAGEFVPNDTMLDGQNHSFSLLTGPNMAGKSTYLRQTALIVLLAQAGLFVPADSAKIGVCDRIFCRVGAQDNLARGESTFLLEMHETASILNNASAQSLVIMDEVGRGTGTQDGLAIAWAVSEHMLNVLQCRTLFATHYHELTAMRHQRLQDISMAVEERSGSVVFLKRVVPGPAAGSYGIHVAGLAGIPDAVVRRAADLRGMLAVREAHHDIQTERDHPQPLSVSGNKKRPHGKSEAAPELFQPEELLVNALLGLDINSMTPLKALQFLSELQSSLKNRR